ncbi:MAG TPA: carbohydrate porin [Bacteroidales bacterium]
MVSKSLTLLAFLLSQVSEGQQKFSDGIGFSTTVTGDFVKNFDGGTKRGFTYLGKEELTFDLNTSKAGLWKNGHLFIHGLNTHGKGPSENLTGDLQVLSNIEAGDHTGLFEFWYSQEFGKFVFLVGQNDMNKEFLGTKYTEVFLNSSFGIMPSVSLNMPVSIYPLAGLGFLIKYRTSQNFICKIGVYDGNPGNFDNNRYNLAWNINLQEGIFGIGEVEYSWYNNDQEVGDLKIGTYIHTGEFFNYFDTLKHTNGNYGVYLLTEKALFPRSLTIGRGLCIFFQGGLTTPSINMVHYFIGGGLRYHGILPNRYYDQLGIGIAHISLSYDFINYTPGTLSNETAFETTYAFHFGGRYVIQPCLQYILNPGATKNIGNSFVGILRFSLTY